MRSIIKVNNLSKQYRVGKAAGYSTLRESLVEAVKAPMGRLQRFARNNEDTIWALKGISFDVEQGDVVGIIGRNGAGKSTLLKVLSRITEPTQGRVDLYGRIGSLLEVGTGFHPELSGKENIYLNGAILGMKRSDIEKRFDEIVAFAEVEKFIHTPVKRYSSGMYLRLAFAVAAHLEPDVLVVDEVLAVGDLPFQEKCLGKMGEVSRQGRTVLFVSHNLNAIWELCPKTIWLDGGLLKRYGPTADVIRDYRSAMHLHGSDSLADFQGRQGSGKMRITNIHLEDAGQSLSKAARSGEPVTFVLEYVAQPGAVLDNVEVNLIVLNDRENRLFALTNKVTGEGLNKLPERGQVRCFVPSIPLIPGEYNIHFSCFVRGERADKALFAAKFSVTEGDFFGTGKLPERALGGDILVKQEWKAAAGRSVKTSS